MGPRASVVVLAALLTSACGANETLQPRGVDTSLPQVSAAQTSPRPGGNDENPCLSEGGPAEPPDSSPDTDGFLGLTKAEAERYARENGQEIRVAGSDGKCFALTMDYRSNRVNVYLENSEVVAATIG